MRGCDSCGMLICRHCGRPVERFDVGWSHYETDAAGGRKYADKCRVEFSRQPYGLKAEP